MAQALHRVAVVVVESNREIRATLAAELSGQVSLLHDAADLAGHLPAIATVVVVGPSATNPLDLDLMIGFRRSHPQLALVVVTEADSPISESRLTPTTIDLTTIWPVRPGEINDLANRAAQRLLETANPQPRSLGRVTTVFSSKGGSGTSMVASNLAAALRTIDDGPVTLLDGDLQSGDIAVMLKLTPLYTIYDAVESGDSIETSLLRRMLVRHEQADIAVLAAPFEPAFGTRVSARQLTDVVAALRSISAHVVIDTAVHFDELLLSLVEQSDDVLLIGGLDVPSVKSLAIGLQMLELLDVPPNRLHLVLNRAGSPVGLDVEEIEEALGLKALGSIPSDIAVPQSVNLGVPLISHDPNHRVSRALLELARRLALRQPADAS